MTDILGDRWQNVPVCDSCWSAIFPSHGEPARYRDPDTQEAPEENCHYCGKDTTSGIYYRAEVSFTRRLVDAHTVQMTELYRVIVQLAARIEILEEQLYIQPEPEDESPQLHLDIFEASDGS